jgi:endonuclease YncB( thermonuclease family)
VRPTISCQTATIWRLGVTLVFGCLIVLASGEESPVLVGAVTKVVDGDTVDVQLSSGPIRVRLHGIDTPERGQPGATEATAALSNLIAGKHVAIEPFSQDRYERMIGIVFLEDLNVNLELVKRGYAWAYRRYMRKADSELCIFEAAARTAKKGLWALPVDQRIPPWEWRRKKALAAFSDYLQETVARWIAATGKQTPLV